MGPIPQQIARMTLLFLATMQFACTSPADPLKSKIDDLRHRLETASEHISRPVVTHRVGNHLNGAVASRELSIFRSLPRLGGWTARR
jgi:hypothetical protein